VTPPAAAASTAHRGRVAAPPRPRVAPPRPRRISGPVRAPVRRPAPAAQPSVGAERGLVLGLLDAVGSLASHGAVDRLIRGRIWIAVIAFALIGIVTLQLLVLQLNANIGRALVRESQLQRENAAYSIENSELAGGERVESKAARLGMALVPVAALRFLTSYPPADVARAAAALNTPVHAVTASTGSSTGSGEASASPASESTVTSASSTAIATGASGEQAPTGEQASSTEQLPAGETTALASTQAGASTTAETPAASEPSAPASAPATAAGGTEPAGAG
jgi:cell division protein FtsL